MAIGTTAVDIALRLKDRASKPTQRAMRSVSTSLRAVKRTAGGVAIAMVAATAAIAAGVAVMVTASRSFIETASGFEKAERQLTNLYQSAERGNAALDYVVELGAKGIPVSMAAARDSFVKLRIAASVLKDESLDPTKGSLLSLIDAVVAYGGSTDQLSRASLAIEQMAGKGVVSLEELRRQLGEAVPVAGQIMARELGMTYADMIALIEKGGLEASRGLKAMYRGFAKDFGGEAAKAANHWDGLTQRVLTQWIIMQRRIMNSGPFMALKAGISGALDELKKFEEDGSLERWANSFASSVVSGMRAAVDATKVLGQAVLGVVVVYQQNMNVIARAWRVMYGLLEDYARAELWITEKTNVFGAYQDAVDDLTTKLAYYQQRQKDATVEIRSSEAAVIALNAQHAAYGDTLDLLAGKIDNAVDLGKRLNEAMPDTYLDLDQPQPFVFDKEGAAIASAMTETWYESEMKRYEAIRATAKLVADAFGPFEVLWNDPKWNATDAERFGELRARAEFEKYNSVVGALYADGYTSRADAAADIASAMAATWYDAEMKRYEATRTADELIAESAERTAAVRERAMHTALSMTQSVTGDMAGLFRQLYEDSGGEAKKYWEAYKAFSVAQTLVATYTASMEAFKSFAGLGPLGPVLGIAAAAAVIGMGMTKVALIQQQQPAVPFAAGGIVTKPTLGLVGEAGPEAIIPLRKLDQVVGGGDVNVTLNMPIQSASIDGQTVELVRHVARQAVMQGIAEAATTNHQARRMLRRAVR